MERLDRMAVDVGESGEQGGSDTQPAQGIEGGKEYHKPHEGFGDVKEKPAQDSNTKHNSEHTLQSGEAAGQNPQTKLIQFASFKRLPQEYQDAIWEFAIVAVEPRVVEIWEGYRNPSHDVDTFGPWTGGFTSPCPIPALLHACSASRRLALQRWRLCFAHGKQPAKIFFDLAADTLYFGHAFDSLDDFRADGSHADRCALRKIAFHLQTQWEVEYFQAGTDLAASLHRNFPALREVVFVERNTAYDWARHNAGRAQRGANPRKTVITFCPPRAAPRFGHQAVAEVAAAYAHQNWPCPQLRHMDYTRSRPPYEKAPIKPSEGASQAAWDEYHARMKYAGEGFLSDDSSSFEDDDDDDDDDDNVGGWLDEVTDLQLRAMLRARPDLRSYYGV